MTEAEIKHEVEREKELIPKSPVALLDRGYMYIKTKEGELIPLKLNNVQRIVLDKILELRKAKKPVRIWILKFRQGGISTLIEALIYAFTSQQPNRNSLIMADEGDKSTHLFEMSKLYHEILVEKQSHLAPALKKDNAKKLEFEGIHSLINIATAENVDAANAFTYQNAHLSEASRFRALRLILAGLMQTVPDHWDTMVIGETTANGIDNDFYEEWQKAKAGTSDWIPLFLGWFLMETYVKLLINGEMETLEGIQFDTDGGYQDFISEEELLQREHNLTNEQLNWRRWAIKNKCQGEVRTFRQEYPADDEEAFLASGDCVFDKLRLKEQKQRAVIKATGTLFREEYTNKVMFRKEVKGKWRVFEDFSPRDKVVIGADVSEGIGQDECGAVALDVRTNDTVMTYVGQTDPDTFALDLALMGEYLNKALIAPENNNMGYATCSTLQKIYPRTLKEQIGSGENKRYKYGFTTDKRSRPDMIKHLISDIRDDVTELRDPDLVNQCLTFVRKPNHKIEAQEGRKDDLVIARMIAGELRIQYPFHARSLEHKKGSLLNGKHGQERRRKREQNPASRRAKGY